MTVTYAPPLTNSPAQYGDYLTHEAIRSGPAYIRTRTSTRWHRIRSAYRRLDHDGEIVETYFHWCGTFSGSYRQPIFADQRPDGEPSCGTCEGRAIGSDPSRPEWLFTPWTLEVPPRCPGAKSKFGTLQAGNRTALCLACGLLVPARACGTKYYSDWCVADHAPGPDLVEPCEFHGWKQLVVVQGVVACRCRVVVRRSA